MNAIVGNISRDYPTQATLPETGATPQRITHVIAASRRAVWAGRTLSGLAVLFLTFDAAAKVLKLGPAVEATAELGYPLDAIRGIGLIEVACLLTYLFPRTSTLGAVLWTGYLGGAIATHLRVGNPLFSHTLFPIYVTALLWVGLWLRDGHLRQILPVRTAQ